MRCSSCFELGHIQKNCTTICSKCGLNGHKAQECKRILSSSSDKIGKSSPTSGDRNTSQDNSQAWLTDNIEPKTVENTANPDLVYIEDIGPEDDTILKDPECNDADSLFVSTYSEDTDTCKYILDTFNMVELEAKNRLREMMNSLPLDEILAFCRVLRDEIMYNALDISFDSACDIE